MTINPLMIVVFKKTKVPTKKQIMYLYRYDWKPIHKFSYDDIYQMFRCFGGPMENEAQFYKMVYDMFGPGSYMFHAFRKGVSGFSTFSLVELEPAGFLRRVKVKSRSEKEVDELRAEINKFDRILKDKEKKYTDAEKKEAREMKQDLMGEKEFSREIVGLEKSKHIISLYLKSIVPVYKFHSYEEYRPRQNYNVGDSSLW